MFKTEIQKIVCLICTLLCFMCLTACGEDKNMAFSVDGILVEKEEWAYYTRDCFTSVEVEIESKYGIDSSEEGFWNNSYPNVVPMDYLKDYVVHKIARAKVEQIVAKEQGIDSPMTWSEQHKAMESDNIARQKKYEQGEILYGKVKRDFYGFYTAMIYSMRQDSMKELVKANIITVTESELKQLYTLQDNPTDSYDELRETLKQQLIESKYEQFIDKRLSNANIVYNDVSIESSYLE